MFSLLSAMGQGTGTGGSSTAVADATVGNVSVGGFTFAPKSRDTTPVVVGAMLITAVVVVLLVHRKKG